jgi:hypothetical protein
MKLKVITTIENLDSVIAEFAKSYNPKQGSVYSFDSFVDTHKRKVVYQLYVDEDSAPVAPISEEHKRIAELVDALEKAQSYCQGIEGRFNYTRPAVMKEVFSVIHKLD